MKTEELNNKGQTLAPYASPRAVVIEVAVQRVVCLSGGTDDSEEGDTSSWWTN